MTRNAPGVLANDTDPEGQTLTVGTPRPQTAPSNGTVSLSADGSFTYTPTAGFSGSDSFTYSVTDGFASSTATVTITVVATTSTYVSSNPWGTTFDSSRYLSLSFPAYLPSGAVVNGATFTHTYRSQGSGTTCYYFETYNGATLLATHGSSSSPVSCATSSWVTDTVSLPEVDSVARANNLTIVLYVENSAGGYSAHREATVAVDYDLP